MSMINEFVEKLIERFKDESVPGFINLNRAIRIANELAEEYKDVPDTNVGKNLSENLIEKIKFGIEASNINDDYTTGLRNGMRYCLSLIDGKEPEFESCKQGWIPVSEHYPDTEKYILLSFSNFSIPVVGRLEEDDNGGTFYIGDEQN